MNFTTKEEPSQGHGSAHEGAAQGHGSAHEGAAQGHMHGGAARGHSSAHGGVAQERTSLHEEAIKQNWFATVSDNPLAKAFPRKGILHAGMSGRPIAPEKIKETYEQLKAQERTGSSVAYVHLPYCANHCIYCGFFGGLYSKALGAEYLESLLWEIRQEAKYTSKHSAPIHALYLGGGTPTALQASELQTLLETLREYLPLANDCEITVEGRLYDFDEKKMEACLAGGANRFSLGVQSFNTELRQRLGRIEPRETVISQLKKLASYNQAAVVIDLIYGLPGQSLDDWQEDIETFLELPIDGVDLYQLNIFPQSALEKAIESKKIPPAVPLEEQGNYFAKGYEIMMANRLHRLSISHWSKNTRERNIYNSLAKNRTDCLHFGTRAGGALHGYIIANEQKARNYMDRCVAGEKPISMIMPPPANFPFIHRILTQMELCRLHLPSLDASLAECQLASSFTSTYELFKPLFENWEEAQLIKCSGDWIDLTIPGQYWQGSLIQALLGWTKKMQEECSHAESQAI